MMNKERRQKLAMIVDQIGDVISWIEEVRDEEQEYFDALPPNLQGSEKGERAEERVGEIEEGLDKLNEIVGELQDLVGDLNNVAD
jgi:hypothetical protein